MPYPKTAITVDKILSPCWEKKGRYFMDKETYSELLLDYDEAVDIYCQHLNILKNGVPKYTISGELTAPLDWHEVREVRSLIRDLGEELGIEDYPELKKKWRL